MLIKKILIQLLEYENLFIFTCPFYLFENHTAFKGKKKDDRAFCGIACI